MRTTVIYKSNGIVELHGVRRIEEDHKAWYVWYGDRKRKNYLHPEIFPKRGGDLLIIQEDPESGQLSDPLNIDIPEYEEIDNPEEDEEVQHMIDCYYDWM